MKNDTYIKGSFMISENQVQSIEQPKTVTERNKSLKAQLWELGYYVQEVGQAGECDYLIVSCAEPKSAIIIEGNSN